MTIRFNRDETFRDDFTFRNSDEAILRFPFPFDRDGYMYTVNMRPHDRSGPELAFRAMFDVDEHYVAECRERALVLDGDPRRCQVLPHMALAEWDVLDLIMTNLAADYPEHFDLHRSGDRWRWSNRPLGLCQEFTFGDETSLPLSPFEYITRQVQGDMTLQDQRDGDLWLDGGMVTAQSGWSLDFVLGMNFSEWHEPVPVAGRMGIFERARKYLLNLRVGHPVCRTNWGMMVHPRLDASLESYPQWGAGHHVVDPRSAADVLHLRVELQSLFRLPRSNAILFSIRVYFISLADICRVPPWAARMHRVLSTLHPELSHYKAIEPYRRLALDVLAPFDDGLDLPAGIFVPGAATLRPRSPASAGPSVSG